MNCQGYHLYFQAYPAAQETAAQETAVSDQPTETITTTTAAAEGETLIKCILIRIFQ